VDRRIASSTQNQALAAILFLYKDVLDRGPGWLSDVVRAKRPRWLPVVLTRQEVHNLLAALDGVSWIMATMLYGSGPRVMECLRLRVQDVDIGRSVALPDALARKSPHADREWGWEWILPASTVSADPRTGERRRHREAGCRTRCATASQRICWKRATTFARSRSCSGIVT
jgi:integrase